MRERAGLRSFLELAATIGEDSTAAHLIATGDFKPEPAFVAIIAYLVNA